MQMQTAEYIEFKNYHDSYRDMQAVLTTESANAVLIHGLIGRTDRPTDCPNRAPN